MGLEPITPNLKDWCAHPVAPRDLPCAPIRTRTGTPGLKVQLTNLYPMRALPKLCIEFNLLSITQLVSILVELS